MAELPRRSARSTAWRSTGWRASAIDDQAAGVALHPVDILPTMGRDLSGLQLSSIIVHEVQAGDPGGVVLSEVVEKLDESVLSFFQQKAVGTLATAGREIIEDANTKSPVPALVKKILKREAALLSSSQNCAHHLASCQQAKTVSPGLLCVARGLLEAKVAVAIVKLEVNAGIQLNRRELNGKRSLSMQSVQDLMLSDNTKVFKAGLFRMASTNLIGVFSDQQVPRTSARGAAAYFLNEFLGCQLAESPEVTTMRFFEAASAFINFIKDEEKKYRYDAALHVELLSNAAAVTPTRFAADHIDKEDRPMFLQALKERNIPLATFDKNVARIEPLIKRRRYEFKSGLQLTGPQTSFEKHVSVADGGGAVTIKDRISRVGTRT